MEQPKHDKYDRLYASIATAVVKAKDDTDIPMDIVGLVEYYRNLKATEDSISRKIVPWISDHPVYDGYLSHIQGIGPMFAANLIAMLTPITDFPKPSMLVAYAGLAGSHYEQECKHGHKFQTSSVKTKCPININEPGEEVMSCGEPIVSTEFVNRPMKRKKGYHILANARRVYAHLFRHTRATLLAQNVAQAPLSKQMGWTQASQMAKVYVHLSDRQQDEAILKGYEKDKEKKRKEP